MFGLSGLIHTAEVRSIDRRTSNISPAYCVQRVQRLGRVKCKHVVPLEEVIPDDVPPQLLFFVSGRNQIKPSIPMNHLSVLAIVANITNDRG